MFEQNSCEHIISKALFKRMKFLIFYFENNRIL